MSAKPSRDQKRKSKLAERARKKAKSQPLAYSGTEYQKPEWTQHVYQTEKAVHETIALSRHALTNGQVEEAFVRLIGHLRAGEPALLADDAPEVPFAPGSEADHLAWNIRRRWGILTKSVGPVATEDLVGILRTLLNSIKAHAWNTGPEKGYVEFIWRFLSGA